VGATDVRAATPLHLAAQRGCMPVALVLSEAGADIEAKDVDGRAPVDLLPQPRAQEMRERGARALFKPMSVADRRLRSRTGQE
jgi:hypothetical protein